MKKIADLTPQPGQKKTESVTFDVYGNQTSIRFPRALLLIQDDGIQPTVEIAVRHHQQPSGFARMDAEQLKIMIDQLQELHKQIKKRE